MCIPAGFLMSLLLDGKRVEEKAMIVYIGMILWILFLGAVCRKRIVLSCHRTNRIQSNITAGIFGYGNCGIFYWIEECRGRYTCIYFNVSVFANRNFKYYETLKSGESEAGFTVFGILVKTFLSEDFHVYLFLIAVISGFCVVFALKKYSPYFTTSMLLFMLMGTFT